MIERKILTEAYWQNEFSVTRQDADDLMNLFLGVQRPMSLEELATALVDGYCRRERNLIERSLSAGTVYRPNVRFSLNDRLVFPHMNFAQGVVVGERAGNNPEYGDFQVVTVQFDKEECQFAAGLQVEHKLSFDDPATLVRSLVPAQDVLYDRFGDLVEIRLETWLKQNKEMVCFREQWLPTSMMLDVHIGYLNLVEAVLDVANRPMSSADLLPDLDLPREVPQAIKLFSVNYAMSRDDRFDDVGANRQTLWGLRRWEPEAVFVLPTWLQYEPAPYDRTKLDVFHLQLEREIDDELSQLFASPSSTQAAAATLMLGYPYRRMGTLPLTDRIRSFFPAGQSDQHSQFTFIDRVHGKEFPGWVARNQRLVYGLKDWFKSQDLPIGAWIKLDKTDAPDRVAIDILPRRMRREWVSMAYCKPDGELGFQMQKRPVDCEYDEICVMDAPDSVVDQLQELERGRDRSMDDVVRSVFLELAKLSSHGTVHAKTLYVAINLIRRCPPGRVFATLFKLPHFISVGEGTWMFNENIY